MPCSRAVPILRYRASPGRLVWTLHATATSLPVPPPRKLVPAASPSYGHRQGRYLRFHPVVGAMTQRGRRIRLTGARRDVIDTDRLAALLLRAALRRAQDDDGTVTDDAVLAGTTAPDDDTAEAEGKRQHER